MHLSSLNPLELCRSVARGFLLSVTAYLLPYLLGIRNTELAITGIFLSAISLGLVLHRQFAETTCISVKWRHILVSAAPPSLCLFSGFGLGLMLLVALITENQLWLMFTFAGNLELVTTGTLNQGQFAEFTEIFPHNIGIMSTVMVLAIIYGAFGLAFSLTWNITLWIVVLVPLVSRTASASREDGLEALIVSTAAITPHVLLEFLAYLQAGLVAVYTRKCYTGAQGYAMPTPVLFQPLLVSFAIGAALLTVAAWSESLFARVVLDLLPVAR